MMSENSTAPQRFITQGGRPFNVSIADPLEQTPMQTAFDRAEIPDGPFPVVRAFAAGAPE